MKNPAVTILMSVKNAEKYLEQCLDSILCQSLIDWELMAVNDNSTDNTNNILEDFEKRDSRIKILNNPGAGIVAALKFGFERSSGSCITRMDADDIMPKNKLKSLFDRLNQRDHIVVTGRVKYFSDKKVSDGYMRYEKWLNSVIEENTFDTNLYRECVIASPNWMVTRNCFEKDISIGELSYPEDYDLVFEWKKMGYIFDTVLEVTHLWREHEKRTSRHSNNYQQPAFFRLKTARFIEEFKDDIDGVQLIGKGEKGKLIAAVLNDHKINFSWFDLKPGDQHKSVMDLEKRLSILSNWPHDEKTQDDIFEFLRKKELRFGDLLWLF